MNWSRKKVKQQGKFVVLLSEDKAHEGDNASFDLGDDVVSSFIVALLILDPYTPVCNCLLLSLWFVRGS